MQWRAKRMDMIMRPKLHAQAATAEMSSFALSRKRGEVKAEGAEVPVGGVTLGSIQRNVPKKVKMETNIAPVAMA